MSTSYILYLDPYHEGDPLFLQSLARELGRSGPGRPPCLILHGSGEKAERLLEAEGHFPERDGEVWAVSTVAERLLVERALRELNRKVVGTLTDAVVASVGVHGLDRRLLRVHPNDEISAGRTGWLEAMMRQHVVPVVSTLVAGLDGPPREAPASQAMAALADALGGDVVCVMLLKSNKNAVLQDGERVAEVGLDAVPWGDVGAPEVASQVVQRGGRVLLTSVRGFLSEAGPSGTNLVA